MKRISIFLLLIILTSCATTIGFDRFDYPIKMRVSEYNVLSSAEKTAFCHGYLIGKSVDTGQELLTNPVSSYELKLRVNQLIRHDARVTEVTHIFYIMREALIQMLTEKHKESA